MPLTTLSKILGRRLRTTAAAAVAVAPLALSGCISSTTPILADAKAILGEQLDIRMFERRDDGTLRDQGVATVQWNGSRYAVARGGGDRLSDFTVHAFEGRDLIVQTAARAPRPVEYAIARRLSDGVYLVIPIQEDVADEATREKFCTKTQEASCRITTPEQLFVFARAMADNLEGRTDGGIAVLVPSDRRR